MKSSWSVTARWAGWFETSRRGIRLRVAGVIDPAVPGHRQDGPDDDRWNGVDVADRLLVAGTPWSTNAAGAGEAWHRPRNRHDGWHEARDGDSLGGTAMRVLASWWPKLLDRRRSCSKRSSPAAAGLIAPSPISARGCTRRVARRRRTRRREQRWSLKKTMEQAGFARRPTSRRRGPASFRHAHGAGFGPPKPSRSTHAARDERRSREARSLAPDGCAANTVSQ